MGENNALMLYSENITNKMSIYHGELKTRKSQSKNAI